MIHHLSLALCLYVLTASSVSVNEPATNAYSAATA